MSAYLKMLVQLDNINLIGLGYVQIVIHLVKNVMDNLISNVPNVI
jgi:hypothetical protein